MANASDLKEFIKNTGLKVTKNRLKILEFLKFSKKPLAVEDISKALKVNIVTTYRILEAFSMKGLIYQTDFRQGKSFFEFQDKDHHHHHVICTKCGNRETLNYCIGNRLTKEAQKRSTFKQIDSHMLEFFGVCKKCFKNN